MNGLKRIAVIGGGISGLAAAWQLSRSPNVEATLLEASDRVGGVLETIYDQGYLIERSADNFATLIPDALEFCRETGFESQLIRPQDKDRRAFVLNRGRILPIPLGFSLMQPTRIDSMLLTGTLSMAGKLRVAQEFFVPRRDSDEDESLESFALRRLGREAFESLVEPIVSGIFTADPKTLSMQATMPQFVEMERKHGGLIRGHLKSRKTQAKQIAGRASGARYDQFMAPAAGMSHWIQHLVQSLPTGCVQLGCGVRSVQQLSHDPAGPKWRLDTVRGPMEFDGLVLGLPAAKTSELLKEACPVLSTLVGGIQYASSAVAVMVVDKADLKRRIDGFGLIVPRKEGRRVLAISYSSNKYAGRTPEDQILLRLFLGGAMSPELVDESDARLQEMAEDELCAVLGWTGRKPRWQGIVRWKNAMPQYFVGHVQRVTEMERMLEAIPGLQLCGAAYRGVGIPQCIRDGRRAARALTS
ncbi:MAG: protoporphyrinogen oxidase [Pirellulaceae bacterium]|nr:protoporphyrinogen oxidase [Pirellulaceae bacterium]